MRYHGAKFRPAPWVISHFPDHSKYVELLGGAAGVLAQKTPAFAEVYNDLDQSVVNVFRVLQDPETRARLFDLCALTPCSRDEFELAYEDTDDPVDAARRTIFRASAGYGNASATKGRSGFRHDSERKPHTAARLWSQYPDVIEEFGPRYCIGAALDKRQLYLTMCELFERFPNAELAEEPEKDECDHNALVFKKLMVKTNA